MDCWHLVDCLEVRLLCDQVSFLAGSLNPRNRLRRCAGEAVPIAERTGREVPAVSCHQATSFEIRKGYVHTELSGLETCSDHRAHPQATTSLLSSPHT